MGDELRETSLEAYWTIRREGLLPRARFEVYERIAQRGPLTGAEIDEQLRVGGGRGHGHKRLPELRRLGCIREVETRICRVTGRRAIAWAVTGRLPEEPQAKPSAPREPEQLTLLAGGRR
jgi:hypothetical protein